MSSNRAIHHAEIPGVVCVKGEDFYLLGFSADWIFDYASYNPTDDPAGWDYTFRGGLLTVLPDHGFLFLEALKGAIVPAPQLKELIETNGLGRTHPQVAANFDQGKYVSSFYDQPWEDYAGEAWEARFGDPLDLVADEMALLWRT